MGVFDLTDREKLFIEKLSFNFEKDGIYRKLLRRKIAQALVKGYKPTREEKLLTSKVNKAEAFVRLAFGLVGMLAALKIPSKAMNNNTKMFLGFFMSGHVLVNPFFEPWYMRTILLHPADSSPLVHEAHRLLTKVSPNGKYSKLLAKNGIDLKAVRFLEEAIKIEAPKPLIGNNGKSEKVGDEKIDNEHEDNDTQEDEVLRSMNEGIPIENQENEYDDGIFSANEYFNSSSSNSVEQNASKDALELSSSSSSSSSNETSFQNNKQHDEYTFNAHKPEFHEFDGHKHQPTKAPTKRRISFKKSSKPSHSPSSVDSSGIDMKHEELKVEADMNYSSPWDDDEDEDSW
eukprot:TRINITY_DN139_c0_g1_i1.p1 TRINITY_DN139_c0_g1~~TRINITY_DN139_c0_g1_i1.p1  ORF type:complete len:345 (+),score=126.22 TRINITY_DN139_c0_g1_i1:33-1067(+)